MNVEEATQEQLDALAREVEELRPLKETTQKDRESFEAKEKEWQEKERQYQEQVNPNWQKARKTIEALKEVAKSKGIEVDEDGNILGNSQGVDIGKIRQEVAEATRREILSSQLESRLGGYTKEEADVIKYHYNKQIVGEDVTIQNIETFIKQAEAAANVDRPSPIKRAFNFSGGQGPRPKEETEGKMSSADKDAFLKRAGREYLIEKK